MAMGRHHRSLKLQWNDAQFWYMCPTIVYSTVYSCSDQRKHQSSASLAFVRGIHRWPVNSPHKRPVTWEMIPFHDVIMQCDCLTLQRIISGHRVFRKLGYYCVWVLSERLWLCTYCIIDYEIKDNGSSNCLLHHDAKPLPKLMLTYF